MIRQCGYTNLKRHFLFHKRSRSSLHDIEVIERDWLNLFQWLYADYMHIKLSVTFTSGLMLLLEDKGENQSSKESPLEDIEDMSYIK
jgi:hypothetical protein